MWRVKHESTIDQHFQNTSRNEHAADALKSTQTTQLGHWPVNDPEGGDGVRRHQARWRQDLALFIGEACYQKRQRTRLFRACELKWIAIQ